MGTGLNPNWRPARPTWTVPPNKRATFWKSNVPVRLSRRSAAAVQLQSPAGREIHRQNLGTIAGRKKGTQLFVLRSNVNQRPASPFFRGSTRNRSDSDLRLPPCSLYRAASVARGGSAAELRVAVNISAIASSNGRSWTPTSSSENCDSRAESISGT